MAAHCLPALLLLAALTATGAAPTALVTLRQAQAPQFRPGHTLPPLTRWGWQMSYDVRLELTERWGYALEFGGYATPDVVRRLDDPNSVEARLCALTAKDPRRYPLAVLTVHGDFGEPPEEAWTHDAQGKLPEGKRIWSPEAPTRLFEEAGRRWAEPLKAIRRRCPVAMVLNGGEYALSVTGHHQKYWQQDPKILAAKGQQSWFEYITAAKARQELPITAAFREAVPDRLLYLYYTTAVCPHYRRWPGWLEWAWDYPPLRTVSDLPNGELYYRHANSGWTGQYDGLTLVLNMVTNHLALGESLTYNWVNAGWVRKEQGDASFSDPARYLGFLKCFYTAGMIGGVAGYFSYPVEADPHCIEQMQALAQAHGLFSWLERDLRQGELLSGPEQHRWSKDRPACELATGDPTARVLARKRKGAPSWLVCAWAADGPDRNVTVEVPELGRLTVNARGCGSVYRARLVAGQTELTLCDPDGLHPTADTARLAELSQ